jgi:hypothetical protein
MTPGPVVSMVTATGCPARRPGPGWVGRLFCGLLACLVAGGALADGRLLLAGTELRPEGERYAYLGAIMPLPGDNRLGKGWVQRYWVDAVRYSYEVSNPGLYGVDRQRIRGSVTGLEAAVGYMFQAGDLGVAGYVGVRHADTTLSPDDPGSRIRGAKLWPKFQLEVNKPLASRWRSENIASYVVGLDGYWLRSRLMHTTNVGHDAGPEVILVGDRDFRALKLGMTYGGLRPTPDLSVSFRGGIHLQEQATGPYVGVDLGLSF